MVYNSAQDRYDVCSYRLVAPFDYFTSDSKVKVKFNKLSDVTAYINLGMDFGYKTD